MPLVPKEVIREGDYFYVDETTGLPKKLHVTKEHLDYWHSSGNEMLSSGLSIPVPYEHQTDHKPQNAAERAANQLKYNAGWVNKFEMKDGKLFSVLDIQDEDAVNKLPKTIRFSSPWFSSFTDGNGKAWKGVISHLALTSRPRITKQEPFGEVGAALSYATAIPPAKVDFTSLPEGPGVTLSRAGLLLPKDGALLEPAFPVAFSLWSGARLALEDLQPKKDKAKADPKARKAEGGSPGTEPSPKKADEGSAPDVPPGDPGQPTDKMPADPGAGALPPIEKSLIDADGDIQVCDVLCDLLDAIGMPLPEGTTKDNLLERLYISAMDRIKGMGAQAAPEEPPGSKPPGAPQAPAVNPIMQESAPMYMSLEKINGMTDPIMKEMAQAMFSMQTRRDALEKNVLTAAQVKRDRRIEQVARNMPAAQRDQLVKMAEGAKLSLGDDGAVIDPLAATLDLLEGSLKKLPSLLLSNGGDADEVPHPRDHLATGVSEERRQEILREIEANTGVVPPRKTA